MPRIKDQRVILSKALKRQAIRDDFEALMNDGRTMKYAINKLIGKYGYSESTIYQIIKRIGKYQE